MSNEEALSIIVEMDYPFYGREETALCMAYEALERLIPKIPLKNHAEYRCSVCGTRVRSGQGSSSRTRDTVCRNCFTVIDWS